MTRSNRRRSWIAIIVLGLLSLAVVEVFWFTEAHDACVTPDEFNLVRDGMTLKEIKETLGKPPKCWAKGPKAGEFIYNWDGSEGIASVALDEDGRVRAKRYHHQSALTVRFSRLLKRLGL